MTTDPYYEPATKVLLMGLEPQLRVADFYYGVLFGSVIGGCLGDDTYIECQ